MEQTAVEWLVEQLPERMKNYLNDSIAIAKEMEKENQLDLIRFLRTQDKMGKSVEDLLEQFKSE